MTIVAALVMLVLLVYCFAVEQWRFAFRKADANTPLLQSELSQQQVTIVVALHNEAHIAHEFAAQLRTNTSGCPVVLVCDHCTDHTPQILYNALYDMPSVTIVENHLPQGKKYAQRLGVELAQTPWIALTDADCAFSCEWTSALLRSALARDAQLVIAPVSMRHHGGVLTRLFALDFLALQMVSVATALQRHATMCNGANMLVARSFYLSHNPHSQYVSGDDMFLLGEAKRKGENIVYCLSKSALVTTPTPASLRSFVRQRTRWLRKATGYTDVDVLRLGWLVFAANITWPVLLLISLFTGLSPVWPLSAFALKTLSEYRLLRSGAEFFVQTTSILHVALLALLYPAMMILVATLSVFRNKRNW